MLILHQIILAFLTLYFIVVVWIYRGTFRIPARRDQHRPFISIVVAARNEEATIEACVTSLLEQNYADDLYEIIIINDRSHDRTREVLDSYAEKYPARIKILTITKKQHTLTGKQFALDKGIAASRGEIILLTDADCTASSDWLQTMATHFAPEVGMVCGFTVVENSPATIWNAIQGMDLLYYLTIAYGLCGWGKAVSCIGNNIAFRKAVYDALGGFSKIGYSVTEDFALLQSVKKTKNEIVFTAQKPALISTKPLPNLGSLITQKKRWAVGGLRQDTTGILLALLLFITHVLLLGVCCAGLVFLSQLWPALIYVGMVTGLNAVLIWRGASLIEDEKSLKFIIIFQLFFILYTFLLGWSILFTPTKIHWKEDVYKV